MILALTLMLCQFIIGIFLIIAGFISISLIFVPIIYIGYGMDLEGIIPI
ncbi:hypothetical protein BC30052_4525 [Bacillus cereus]|nr:hypothetical protein BC30052_4525 [Bacillus cereus]